MNEETKEVHKSVADHAKQEKSPVLRRKCIVTFIGIVIFVLFIFLGVTLLPMLTKTSRDIIGGLSAAIAFGGLALLWMIVIRENRKDKNKKKD